MSFENAYNYTGAPLEVLIATDYDGTSDPSTQGTWNPLPANWSTGGFSWVNSGDIDISSYSSTNVHVAFKYTGSSSDGSTWEIDDVKIKG